MRNPAIPCLMALLLLATSAVGPLQAQDVGQEEAPGGEPGARPPSLVLPAVRIQGDEPVIDGALDDVAWASAPVATDFTQMEPREGEAASQRTEVRVLYGTDALFVAFRAFDSAPDSIAAQLTRRDQDSYSDKVHLLIDSYFDRRTAFHFGVNPAGVKMDLYRFDDTEEDPTWDAVWDVATRVDEEGWTAEFKIPYSQLRFGNQDDQTWGINFAREIARNNETSSWAPLRQNEAAVVSKSGELQGLKGLGSPRRMEMRPFTLARLTRAPGNQANPFYHANDFFSSAGLDLKYGVTNDLTLDLTVNPDFGQVEADPAQVNLTAYETFYPERRPFFIEGQAIFNFGIGIGDGEQGSESLFYSRRIGRAPQGSVDARGGFLESPEVSTILGAWKLSGKTQDGWSVGFLHAVTGEESAQIASGDGLRSENPVEPLTNYGVARLQRDFREGRSAVGFIGTATNRDKGVADELEIRSGAYAGGFDFRHRFGAEDRFQLSGFLLGSNVRGSPEAIARTQTAPTRYYQRPDADHTDYDPTRTSLSGWAGKFEFRKIGGSFWNWGTTAVAKSPGFEVNDLGFMQESDLVVHAAFLGYNHHTPTKHLRRWNANVNAWHAWSFGGERLSTGGNINGGLTLPSYWGAYLGINHDAQAFSNGTLRGGPLLRREGRTNGWLNLFTDGRKPLQGNGGANWVVASESDSWSIGGNLNLRWRPSGRANLSLGSFYNRGVTDAQWVSRISTNTDHYVFGRLDQKTIGLTARMDLTFIPDLTLQVYAQPFVSAGRYTDFKQVGDPRASEYGERFQGLTYQEEEGRYRSDLDGNGTLESFRNPDFNVRQFRSNVVLRWEYKPGSLLYLVWSQGRNDYGEDGRLRFSDSFQDLFRAEAENVLMLKVSYWISP